MDNVCLCCKKHFPARKSLHLHIAKGEKITLPDYYHMFFPREDLLTKELIKYKDYDQYFTSFFNSKENLNYWFIENYHTPKASEVAKDILKTRKERKALKLAPTQVELRTINCPSIIGIQKMFNYNEFCEKINLKSRYVYGIIPALKKTKDLSILIDTREQTPFSFPNSRVAKLDVGDYTAAEPDYSDIFIERKSLSDFFGTFYNESNFERFKKEIKRAESMGLYLIVLIEATLNTCMEHRTLFVKDRNYSSHTFKNVRELLEKYENIQFVFSYNHTTAKQLCLSILSQGEDIKNYDLQYLVDTKQI